MLGDLSHTLFLRISRRAYCFFNIEPERLRQSGSDFSCLPFILIMAICSAGSAFPLLFSPSYIHFVSPDMKSLPVRCASVCSILHDIRQRVFHAQTRYGAVKNEQLATLQTGYFFPLMICQNLFTRFEWPVPLFFVHKDSF